MNRDNPLDNAIQFHPNDYVTRTGIRTEMSVEETALAFARRCVDRAVAYLREFALVGAYVTICVAVTAPVLVATGGAIYRVSDFLGLEGTARVAYFGAGVVAIMFEFAMLHRFVQRLGLAMLGPTRELKF